MGYSVGWRWHYGWQRWKRWAWFWKKWAVFQSNIYQYPIVFISAIRSATATLQSTPSFPFPLMIAVINTCFRSSPSSLLTNGSCHHVRLPLDPCCLWTDPTIFIGYPHINLLWPPYPPIGFLDSLRRPPPLLPHSTPVVITYNLYPQWFQFLGWKGDSPYPQGMDIIYFSSNVLSFLKLWVYKADKE